MHEELDRGSSQIAILAGGRATRLGAITRDLPKSMIPLAGKPFILHQLDLLKRNGIFKMVICAGYLGEKIRQCVKDGSEFGASIEFSFDGEALLGTGGALLKAISFLQDPFFVMYGDSYLDTDFGPIMDHFLSSGKGGLMTVFRNEDRFGRSNMVYEDGKIIRYDKDKTSSCMRYIDYGLMIFRKETVSRFKGCGSFDMTELCRNLIDQDEMSGYEVTERFYEIGSPEGLKETEKYIESRVLKQR